jgi:hypothetical protein
MNIDRWPAAFLIYPENTSDSILVTIDSSDIEVVSDSESYTLTNYPGMSIADIVSELNANLSSHKVVQAIDIGKESVTPDSIVTTGLLDFNSPSPAVICRYTGVICRPKESSVIQLKPPRAASGLVSWHPIIGRGKFSARFSDVNFQRYPGIDSSSVYTFSIPEFYKQEWSPQYGMPYKDVEGEFPEIIGYHPRVKASIIKVANRPIYYDNNISIMIKGVRQSNSIIRYVDTNNGLIYLSQKISNREDIRIDYTFHETDYVYDGIDLNPLISHNPTIIDSYIAFYIKPSHCKNSIISGGDSVFHEIVNAESAAKTKIARMIPETAGTLNPLYEPVIYLGSMNVREGSTYKDFDVIDTRTRGGGISEKEISKNTKLWRESEFFYDIGNINGLPIPGNAGVIVNVPGNNLINQGMSEEEIKERATRSIAMGVVPIVEMDADGVYNVENEKISLSMYSGDEGVQPVSIELKDTSEESTTVESAEIPVNDPVDFYVTSTYDDPDQTRTDYLSKLSEIETWLSGADSRYARLILQPNSREETFRITLSSTTPSITVSNSDRGYLGWSDCTFELTATARVDVVNTALEPGLRLIEVAGARQFLMTDIEVRWPIESASYLQGTVDSVVAGGTYDNIVTITPDPRLPIPPVSVLDDDITEIHKADFDNRTLSIPGYKIGIEDYVIGYSGGKFELELTTADSNRISEGDEIAIKGAAQSNVCIGVLGCDIARFTNVILTDSSSNLVATNGLRELYLDNVTLNTVNDARIFVTGADAFRFQYHRGGNNASPAKAHVQNCFVDGFTGDDFMNCQSIILALDGYDLVNNTVDLVRWDNGSTAFSIDMIDPEADTLRTVDEFGYEDLPIYKIDASSKVHTRDSNAITVAVPDILKLRDFHFLMKSSASTNITFENNEFIGLSPSVLKLGTAPEMNLTFKNNTIHHCEAAVVQSSGGHEFSSEVTPYRGTWEITDNDFKKCNVGFEFNSKDGVFFTSFTDATGTDAEYSAFDIDVTIKNNVFTNCGKRAGYFNYLRSLTFLNNEITDQELSSIYIPDDIDVSAIISDYPIENSSGVLDVSTEEPVRLSYPSSLIPNRWEFKRNVPFLLLRLLRNPQDGDYTEIKVTPKDFRKSQVVFNPEGRLGWRFEYKGLTVDGRDLDIGISMEVLLYDEDIRCRVINSYNNDHQVSIDSVIFPHMELISHHDDTNDKSRDRLSLPYVGGAVFRNPAYYLTDLSVMKTLLPIDSFYNRRILGWFDAEVGNENRTNKGLAYPSAAQSFQWACYEDVENGYALDLLRNDTKGSAKGWVYSSGEREGNYPRASLLMAIEHFGMNNKLPGGGAYTDEDNEWASIAPIKGGWYESALRYRNIMENSSAPWYANYWLSDDGSVSDWIKNDLLYYLFSGHDATESGDYGPAIDPSITDLSASWELTIIP